MQKQNLSIVMIKCTQIIIRKLNKIENEMLHSTTSLKKRIGKHKQSPSERVWKLSYNEYPPIVTR